MSVVKAGYLKRHSKSWLSGGWNPMFVEIRSDSMLYIYKKQGDSTPKGKVFMKEVAKHFAYGTHSSSIPDRPDLPSGGSIDCVLAVPIKPSHKAKVHWFLCNSEAELHDWMAAIVSTLPPAKTKSTSKPTQSTSGAIVPERRSDVSSGHHYPPQPSAPIGFSGYQGGPPPPQPSYPPQGYAPPPQGYAPPAPGYGPPPPAYGPPPPAYAPPPPQYQQYPQQGYPQQGYQGYPQQGYQGYPQQGYPQQQAYPQQGGYYAQPHQQQPNVVYVKEKKKSGLGGVLGGGTAGTAAALVGGAALGYGASRMFSPFGGFGFGRHGSWSSFSSFGSCGSFGSWSS